MSIQVSASLIVAFFSEQISCPAAPTQAAAFVKMCLGQMKHARHTQGGFLAYQTALEDQKAFSEEFYTSERDETFSHVTQIEDCRNELVSLIDDASALPNAMSDVTEQMQVDLAYVRSVLAYQSQELTHNHCFYKTNWTLLLTKTGVLPLRHFFVPDVDVYLKNPWGAQYWAHVKKKRRCSSIVKRMGLTKFLSDDGVLKK